MIRGNVLFEVEKIEQLALINRLTTHHDLRPSLKGSDDGIMIRQYPRGLFQQHRPKADMNAQTVTLFRGPERPRFSRHETREQADEPQGQDYRSDRRQPRPGPRARRGPGGS